MKRFILVFCLTLGPALAEPILTLGQKSKGTLTLDKDLVIHKDKDSTFIGKSGVATAYVSTGYNQTKPISYLVECSLIHRRFEQTSALEKGSKFTVEAIPTMVSVDEKVPGIWYKSGSSIVQVLVKSSGGERMAIHCYMRTKEWSYRGGYYSDGKEPESIYSGFPQEETLTKIQDADIAVLGLTAERSSAAEYPSTLPKIK